MVVGDLVAEPIVEEVEIALGSLDCYFELLSYCGAVERPFGAELYGDPADSLQTWAAIGAQKSRLFVH